jgi:hypothetical protein
MYMGRLRSHSTSTKSEYIARIFPFLGVPRNFTQSFTLNEQPAKLLLKVISLKFLSLGEDGFGESVSDPSCPAFEIIL